MVKKLNLNNERNEHERELGRTIPFSVASLHINLPRSTLHGTPYSKKKKHPLLLHDTQRRHHLPPYNGTLNLSNCMMSNSSPPDRRRVQINALESNHTTGTNLFNHHHPTQTYPSLNITKHTHYTLIMLLLRIFSMMAHCHHSSCVTNDTTVITVTTSGGGGVGKEESTSCDACGECCWSCGVFEVKHLLSVGWGWSPLINDDETGDETTLNGRRRRSSEARSLVWERGTLLSNYIIPFIH